MNKFIPNSFQTPNVLVDELMPLLTGDEWKVLCYMTRHILGFQDRIAQRRHYISLSTFVKGNKAYPGCGLGQNAIRTCLESLTKHRIIKAIDKPTAKGQLWELDYDSPDIDIDGLTERAQASNEKGKRRTASARSVRHNPSVGHKGYVSHKGTVMSDITPALMTDINNQTQSSNTPSNPLNTKNIAPVGAKSEEPLEVLPSPKTKPLNVNRWNDKQIIAYFTDHSEDMNAISKSRGIDPDRVPFKNWLVSEQKRTIKILVMLCSRQINLRDYIAFLMDIFKWRKPCELNFSDYENNVAKYESKKAISAPEPIPQSTPEELAKGFKTFAESQASLLGKGRAS